MQTGVVQKHLVRQLNTRGRNQDVRVSEQVQKNQGRGGLVGGVCARVKSVKADR